MTNWSFLSASNWTLSEDRSRRMIVSQRSTPEVKANMELLIFIILVIGAVVAFDLLAAAFGVDSRPAMNDDRATMWRI